MNTYKYNITESNPLIVENYPYGFRLRTQMKVYIETTKQGQRYVTQTLNPKTSQWNKEKKSTYSDIVLIGIEEQTGHYFNASFSIDYSDEEDLKKWLSDKDTSQFSEYQQKQLKRFNAINETRKHISVVVRPQQQRTEEQEREEEEKQKEVTRSINKLYVHNALKEGLTKEDIIGGIKK